MNVTCLTPRRTLQIRDIDCLTTEEEVEVALKEVLKETGPIQVRLSQPNIREQRSAAVEMDEKAAFKLIKKGSIKLGVSNCRVRLQATPMLQVFGFWSYSRQLQRTRSEPTMF